MKRNLTLLVLLLTTLFEYSYAQYTLKQNNVWVFGKNAGMDFNSGTATPILTNFSVSEGCASVCDASGQLLFYAGGDTVYNKNGKGMPNGGRVMSLSNTSLAAGAIRGSSSSSTQGMVIVPVIGSATQYYVFCTEGSESMPTFFGGKLSYSIVDMTLDGGLGDVVTGKKAIKLDSGVSEKLLAVPGNDCNVWVLVHSVGNEIRAFEVTATGIDTTPVVSTVGTLAGRGLFPYLSGAMKASPNRRKLAITSLLNSQGPVGAEICDFDPATGIVSNAMVLDSGGVTNKGCYSAAFSPDNSKVYIGGNDTPAARKYTLCQYDLSQSTPQAIISSKYNYTAITGFLGKDMRLGPDGKLYMAVTGKTILSVVEFPNLAGAASNYTYSAITLATGATCNSGLPAEYVVPLPPDTTGAHAFDTSVCNAADVHLQGRTGYSIYKWSTGSSDTAIMPTQTGIYWVLSTGSCHSFVDTFVVTVVPLPAPVISVNGFELSVSNTYSTYQWYKNGQLIFGATNATYTVTANGTYCVKVTNAIGCSDSTVCKEITNVGVLSVVQIQKAINIYPNPATNVLHIASPVAVRATINSIDGKEVIQVNDTKNIDISKLENGMYIINIADTNGVVLKNEKFVKIK